MEPSTDPSISQTGFGDPRNIREDHRGDGFQARRKAQNGAESEEEAPSQVSTGSGQIDLIYENLVLEMGNWLVVWNIFFIFHWE